MTFDIRHSNLNVEYRTSNQFLIAVQILVFRKIGFQIFDSLQLDPYIVCKIKSLIQSTLIYSKSVE